VQHLQLRGVEARLLARQFSRRCGDDPRPPRRLPNVGQVIDDRAQAHEYVLQECI
jgi:hypothetical protein